MARGGRCVCRRTIMAEAGADKLVAGEPERALSWGARAAPALHRPVCCADMRRPWSARLASAGIDRSIHGTSRSIARDTDRDRSRPACACMRDARAVDDTRTPADCDPASVLDHYREPAPARRYRAFNGGAGVPTTTCATAPTHPEPRRPRQRARPPPRRARREEPYRAPDQRVRRRRRHSLAFLLPHVRLYHHQGSRLPRRGSTTPWRHAR